MTHEEMMKKLKPGFFEEYPELVGILTPELYEEFGKVPPTVEGIGHFIDTHNDRQLRAFNKNTTPEQLEAYLELIKILCREHPRI